MTPTIDAPSYAYTDLQTSTVCVEEDLEDQEEKYKHAGPNHTTKSPPVPCSCERQLLNALRASFLSYDLHRVY